MEISVLDQQNVLLENRERVLQDLRKYTNVINVGVGLKEINNEFTSAIC
jgi:hypothetical protein